MIMVYDGNKYMLIEAEDISKKITVETIPVLKIKGMCLKCFCLEVIPVPQGDSDTTYVTMNPSALINPDLVTVFFSGINFVWAKDVSETCELYNGFLQKFYTNYMGFKKAEEDAKLASTQPQPQMPPAPMDRPVPPQAQTPYQNRWQPRMQMPNTIQPQPTGTDPNPHV